MKLLKHAIVLSIILVASFIVNCGKTPLLTDIGTSKLIIVIKGTYESSGRPQNWILPDVCQTYDADGNCTAYTPQHEALVKDDSVVNCNAPQDDNPHAFMIDIAELKLADANGHQYKFSNYRQTFAFSLSDDDPFFNGLGTIVSSDDVPSQVYPAVGLYIRKMLTDSARKYLAGSTGWISSATWDVFGEKEYPAFNFNKFQTHSVYDALRLEGSYYNRVFPLVIPVRDVLTQGMGMYFDIKNQVTVLEIRIVVKNFLKKYEYVSSGSGSYSVVHYYGLSDWLQDVQPNERNIGGNILTVARSYIPGMVGTIRGSNGRTHGAHIIAIPRGEDINNYTIPGGDGTVCNWSVNPPVLPAGIRKANPCNMPRIGSQYTGSSISQALDYYINVEKYKYEWNKKMQLNVVTDPGPPPVVSSSCPAGIGTCCADFTDYKTEWSDFALKVGKCHIPQLAVYADAGGEFSFLNVPPGNYDLWIAQRPPVYGVLYYSYDPAHPHPTFGTSDFKPYSGNPVTVTIGSSYDKDGNRFLSNVQ